jgi:hypothetical protein
MPATHFLDSGAQENDGIAEMAKRIGAGSVNKALQNEDSQIVREDYCHH